MKITDSLRPAIATHSHASHAFHTLTPLNQAAHPHTSHIALLQHLPPLPVSGIVKYSCTCVFPLSLSPFIVSSDVSMLAL